MFVPGAFCAVDGAAAVVEVAELAAEVLAAACSVSTAVGAVLGAVSAAELCVDICSITGHCKVLILETK